MFMFNRNRTEASITERKIREIRSGLERAQSLIAKPFLTESQKVELEEIFFKVCIVYGQYNNIPKNIVGLTFERYFSDQRSIINPFIKYTE